MRMIPSRQHLSVCEQNVVNAGGFPTLTNVGAIWKWPHSFAMATKHIGWHNPLSESLENEQQRRKLLGGIWLKTSRINLPVSMKLPCYLQQTMMEKLHGKWKMVDKNLKLQKESVGGQWNLEGRFMQSKLRRISVQSHGNETFSVGRIFSQCWYLFYIGQYIWDDKMSHMQSQGKISRQWMMVNKMVIRQII